MYNTKKIGKNAFRISKVRNESAIRLRIPGGDLKSKYLTLIGQLADDFGNGTVHLTTRQGFEIPGIKLSELDKIKQAMSEMIYEIEKESSVVLEEPQQGYPSAGTRNVSACIGDKVCRFANCDAPALAQRIESVIYPNDYHLKVAVTACANDCIKVHMQDIGIVSKVVPEYDSELCIGCEACVDNCKLRVTNALTLDNYKVMRDEQYCLGCGECILKCPMGALFRGQRLYRILLGGRTGKRNPRLANTFIEDASEEVVLALCKNVYVFIDRNINRKLPKEHLGYIIDRAGIKTFISEVTNGINMNPEARIVKLHNPGYYYPIKK